MAASGAAGILAAFLDCAGSGGNYLHELGENVRRWSDGFPLIAIKPRCMGQRFLWLMVLLRGG